MNLFLTSFLHSTSLVKNGFSNIENEVEVDIIIHFLYF